MWVLEPDGKSFFIVHENCNRVLGCVYKDGNQWLVERWDVEGDIEIATVNSPEEAIPPFAAHYEQHPPEWAPSVESWFVGGQPRSPGPFYSKATAFGWLDVRPDKHGAWFAYRGASYALLRDGEPAIFATREEAQRAADMHENDDYGNNVPINDGYSWDLDPSIDEWLAERGRSRNRTETAAAA